jgi:hypothetical protein
MSRRYRRFERSYSLHPHCQTIQERVSSTESCYRLLQCLRCVFSTQLRSCEWFLSRRLLMTTLDTIALCQYCMCLGGGGTEESQAKLVRLATHVTSTDRPHGSQQLAHCGSGHLHAPATSTLEKEPPHIHWIWAAWDPEPMWVLWRRDKSLARAWNRTMIPRSSCPQPSVTARTGCATKRSRSQSDSSQNQNEFRPVTVAVKHLPVLHLVKMSWSALTAQGLPSCPNARVQAHPLLLPKQGVTWTAGVVGRVSGPWHGRCCRTGSVPGAPGKSTLAAGGWNRNTLLSCLHCVSFLPTAYRSSVSGLSLRQVFLFSFWCVF